MCLEKTGTMSIFFGNMPNITISVCIVWQSTDYIQWYCISILMWPLEYCCKSSWGEVMSSPTWWSDSGFRCPMMDPHPAHQPYKSGHKTANQTRLVASTNSIQVRWYIVLNQQQPAKYILNRIYNNIRKYFILKQYVFKTFTDVYYVNKK